MDKHQQKHQGSVEQRETEKKSSYIYDRQTRDGVRTEGGSLPAALPLTAALQLTMPCPSDLVRAPSPQSSHSPAPPCDDDW